MSDGVISNPAPSTTKARRWVHSIIESAGPGERSSEIFDACLAALIVLNVGAACLESVSHLNARYGSFFRTFELVSVAIFTVEYSLRLWCCVEKSVERFRSPVRGRLRYAASSMALIDLAAIAPFYLGALLSIDLRFLRALRIVRFLKLSHYFGALNVLLDVLRAERNALEAAFFLLLLAVLLASSGIYVFEHDAQPDAFASIPAAMWWSLTTLTTVGYGDVTPITAGGKVFGACIMVLGVGMVALPTGILATGFSAQIRRRRAVFADAADLVLADGHVDPSEKRYLEEVRTGLFLSREEVSDLDPTEGGAAARLPPVRSAEPASCPHCGERLPGSWSGPR